MEVLSPLPTSAETPISIQQASELCGLSIQTIYIKASRGEFPRTKKGGKLYFFRSEILAWINSGKKEGQVLCKP